MNIIILDFCRDAVKEHIEALFVFLIAENEEFSFAITNNSALNIVRILILDKDQIINFRARNQIHQLPFSRYL